MIPKGAEVACRIVPDGVHPAFSPSLAENVLVDPLFEMGPKEGRTVLVLAFTLGDEIEKARTPFRDCPGKPLRDVSLCTLNRTDPKREGFPGHVLLPRTLQLSPRDGCRLPLRHLACHSRHPSFEFAGAPEALGFGLDHCGSNLPRQLVPAI